MIFVIHLEYKRDKQPGKSGTGDTLRLIHALNNPDLRNEDISIVSTSKKSDFDGIFTYSNWYYIEPTTKSKSGKLNSVDLYKRLIHLLGDKLNDSLLFHTYIGDECHTPWDKIEISYNGYNFFRQRIDSSFPNKSFLFWNQWKPLYANSCSNNVIAVFIRKIATDPKRNTPDWFIELIRNIIKQVEWNILWCGNTDMISPQNNEIFYDYNGHSIIEQLKYLSSHARCAIGWNSGGLDLAAAANIPILRIGEFQKHSSCKKYKWGSKYNSFLACKSNIGLASKSLKAKTFNKDIIAKSLKSFLKNINYLSNRSIHVILNINEYLKFDENELILQLEKHEIKWE